MKKFTRANIRDIPIELAHGGSGSRQVLITPEKMTSPYFVAVTKGYLNSGSTYDWHSHEDIDEFFVVLQGHGIFYCQNEAIEYTKDDVITIPANSRHKITASGNTSSEFYFVRIKVK